MASTYNIGAVARRAGLTVHVLRVWERRYRAVRPTRTEGNQRLYAAEDVERLRLMSRLCRSGHRIGQMARLPAEELRRLAVGAAAETEPDGAVGGTSGLLSACRDAVEAADGPRLGRILETARVFVPPSRLLSEVVLPLMRWVGDRWKAGALRILHEHIATAEVRALLERLVPDHPPSDRAPCVVIATPPGEWHELGCLSARAIARERGWRVVYLGAGVPAAEIVEAARRHGAAGVVLGITAASGARQASTCLRSIRKALDSNLFVVSGGPAASRCSRAAGLKPSCVMATLDAFGRKLGRRRGIPAAG